jgi:hypothetical protein
VGSGAEAEDGPHDSFIVKTRAACNMADLTGIDVDDYEQLEDVARAFYPELTDGGSDCKGWDWITRYGTSGKADKANWVAESPDGTYFIVAGITEASTGKSDMNIAKIAATDGEVLWEMNYESGSGAETIAFTSDGGFIVGGYIDCG